MQLDDAIRGVVLAGRGRERRQVGQPGQRWGDDGVSFGGGVVLALVFIHQGNLRL